MAEQRFYATGKRKTAIARVWIQPGTGQIMINKKPVDDYIDREINKMIISQPLMLTGVMGKVDIYATVKGGGITGQAGAIRHGISKALLELNPEFREKLKRAGFITRDSRVKERKKYGQPGARKSYQFSKR